MWRLRLHTCNRRVSTPPFLVWQLRVDPALLGPDGLLMEMEGSAEYLERRKVSKCTVSM
jgi:hypothetical protein